MDRIEKARFFLQSLINCTERKRKKLIREASTEEIKTLVELIYNLRELPLSKDEQALISPHKKTLQQVLRKKWNVDELRTFFVKKHSVLPILVTTVLCKLFDLFFCNLVSENDACLQSD